MSSTDPLSLAESEVHPKHLATLVNDEHCHASRTPRSQSTASARPGTERRSWCGEAGQETGAPGPARWDPPPPLADSSPPHISKYCNESQRFMPSKWWYNSLYDLEFCECDSTGYLTIRASTEYLKKQSKVLEHPCLVETIIIEILESLEIVVSHRLNKYCAYIPIFSITMIIYI
jgi:hypothetical protein